MPWQRLKATVVQTHTQQTHSGEVGGAWNYDLDVLRKMKKKTEENEGTRMKNYRQQAHDFQLSLGTKKKCQGGTRFENNQKWAIKPHDAIYWLGMLVHKALYIKRRVVQSASN